MSNVFLAHVFHTSSAKDKLSGQAQTVLGGVVRRKGMYETFRGRDLCKGVLFVGKERVKSLEAVIITEKHA